MKLNILNLFKSVALAGFMAFSVSCSSDQNKKEGSETTDTVQSEPSKPEPEAQGGGESGVGPFQNVEISAELDQALVEQGKVLFDGRCIVCHQFEERYVGPSLGGVTERRNSDWVMNMIFNPSEMLQKDPIAKELLTEYGIPMVNTDIDEKDTRAIYEYLRAHDMGEAN